MLAGYRHCIGHQNDPICPERGAETETLSHPLTDRPILVDPRVQVFGRDDPILRERSWETGLGWWSC